MENWTLLRSKVDFSRIEHQARCPHGYLTFYHAIYFIIVTISTVGYSDITMHSDWGRAVTLFTILIALLILPAQINNIMELASRRARVEPPVTDQTEEEPYEEEEDDEGEYEMYNVQGTLREWVTRGEVRHFISKKFR